jgi:hypothetical protein
MQTLYKKIDAPQKDKAKFLDVTGFLNIKIQIAQEE